MKYGSAMLILLLAAVAMFGCGDESASEDQAEATPSKRTPQLAFEADPGGELAYTAKQVTAREGNVTIAFTNPQAEPHNVTIEGEQGWTISSQTIEDGFDASTNVSLIGDDRFVFYCSVPGHRAAGMEGVVKVTPVS